jgi:hypothetical protein
MSAHMGEFGFAYTLGSSISQPIQDAIVSGFQMGVSLMTKPFEYFANAFGERIQDQLSDLKAAGGLFSVSQRSKTPFLKTMDDAVQFQQDTNKVFARMAADLPGVTNDYVQVGKRLSDTMARITSGDFQNALAEANRIRGTEEGRKYYGQTITGTGADAQKQVITTLLGEMTKKTTLAGLGGRSGAGGVMGAYGLPQLTERMLSQDKVSMGQFQKYAAVFSDPTVSDALSRNIDLVNKTMPNTAARFKAMQKLLDEVVTPDMIEKLRTSVDGVYQGLKSAIFDPDTGLFGLGRQFQNIGKRLNQYGQYVDKTGKVVTDLSKAADEDLSVFEIISNIFSNAGQVLAPIVQNLPLVFDPLKKVANLLMDARHYTAEFARTFNQYREGLKVLSEVKGKDFLKDTLDFRSSLAAINNLLFQIGAIGKGSFMKNADMLMNSKDMDFGAMMSGMLDQLMNSKVAGKIGETVGQIVGTVLSEVAKVTGFISGRITSSNKLFDGLKKGFDEAGGTAAFKNIFKDVFKSLFNVLVKIAKLIPIEGYMLAAAAIIIPAAIQGLAMSFAERMVRGISGMFRIADSNMGRSFARSGADALGGAGGGFMQTRAMRRQQLLMQQAAARRAAPYIQGARTIGAFGMDAFNSSRVGRGVASIGRGVGAAARFVPGAAVAGGVLSGANSLMQGEGVGRAIAQTFGTVLGATAGSVFGPVGTAIGGMAGDMLTRKLINSFDPAAIKQELAAKQQLEAAAGQQKAAVLRKETGTNTPFAFDSQKLTAVLKLASGSQTLTPQQQALVEALKARNIDAQNFAAVSKTLENMKVSLAAVYTPGTKAYKDALSSYEQVVSEARTKLEASQTKFDEGFAKLPANITKTVVTKISTMGTEQIQAALAAKINAIQLQQTIADRNKAITDAGGTPGIIPNPYSGKLANPLTRYKGGLGDSIASEMKHKPSGSNLVIANSSETVIPAAGGYGMKDFMGYLHSGFDKVSATFQSYAKNNDNRLKGMTEVFAFGQEQTNEQLQVLNQKVAVLQQQSAAGMGGMGGGLFGGGAGGGGAAKVVQIGKMLQGMGLNVAENPAFGSGRVGQHAPGSYHYSGRAIDVTGSPAQLDAAYAQLLNTNPAELLWRVPGHFDHLHVAYALGAGMPAFFGSQNAAINWEKSMVPSSVRVGSVTSNSSEGFGGGPITINAPVTIHQQPNQDAEDLAALVAIKIGEAVSQARSSSVFV